MEDLEKCEDQLTKLDEKMEYKERTTKTRRVMRKRRPRNESRRKIFRGKKRTTIEMGEKSQ